MKNLTNVIGPTVQAQESYGAIMYKFLEEGDSINDLWENFNGCMFHEVTRAIRIDMSLRAFPTSKI